MRKESQIMRVFIQIHLPNADVNKLAEFNQGLYQSGLYVSLLPDKDSRELQVTADHIYTVEMHDDDNGWHLKHEQLQAMCRTIESLGGSVTEISDCRRDFLTFVVKGGPSELEALEAAVYESNDATTWGGQMPNGTCHIVVVPWVYKYFQYGWHCYYDLGQLAQLKEMVLKFNCQLVSEEAPPNDMLLTDKHRAKKKQIAKDMFDNFYQLMKNHGMNVDGLRWDDEPVSKAESPTSAPK